jgi:hypothetical protein
MNYITRNKSLITGNELEHLKTLYNSPVYMGCTGLPKEEDKLMDMVWGICPDTGLIQLEHLVPLEVLYQHQHNDGTGKVWDNHFREFAYFINRFNPRKVLEIGAAHTKLVQQMRVHNPGIDWAIVEPNAGNIKDSRTQVIEGWFDGKFESKEHYDTIIHSHVLEHQYDPLQFLKDISAFLKTGDKMIFSFPNMLEMLKQKFTNCLNFEHTILITENVVEHWLDEAGFQIEEKMFFGSPHSIFYSTIKSDRINHKIAVPRRENCYEENKRIFDEFIKYHEDLVADLNEKMSLAGIKSPPYPTYLFGAHIFSQYLIQFGLDESKIKAVLDNSEMKQGLRLYGTGLMVESPKVLEGKGPVNVILKAGIYNDEIEKQLKEINNQINIL